ncbi:MAG: thioredoxin family protein [Microscillaceae bacterium]|jgi:peroxiredoxin|nr:thioredoxin family protein [Microscillaceae bacterium]
MKKINLLFVLTLGLIFSLSNATFKTQGYQVGDTAIDFSLKNIDGKMVSLQDFAQAKGFVIIFTCNHCPYAIANEDRIIALNKKYAAKGFPVIAINPNDPVAYPDDSYDNMKKRAQEKGFNFPYLLDDTQDIAKTYGATKTPHVYLLDKNRVVKYIGAIDDSPKDAKKAKTSHLANAIDALLAGKTIAVSTTAAIGCGIKWKK